MRLLTGVEDAVPSGEHALIRWLTELRRRGLLDGDSHNQCAEFVHAHPDMNLRDLADSMSSSKMRFALSVAARKKIKECAEEHFHSSMQGMDASSDLNSIGSRAGLRFRSIRHMLKKLDTDATGAVTRESLEYFFRVLNLNKSQMMYFWDSLEKDAAGNAHFSEVVAKLAPHVASAGHEAHPRAFIQPAPSDADSDASAISRPMRDMFQRFWEKAQGRWRSLRELFIYLDVNRSGYVRRKELEELFLHFNLPRESSNAILEYLGLIDGGGISFSELACLIAPFVDPLWIPDMASKAPSVVAPSEFAMPAEVRDAADIIGRKLELRFRSAVRAFRWAPAYVSREEFADFVANCMAPRETADVVFAYLDSSNRGVVNTRSLVQFFSSYIVPGYPTDGTATPPESMAASVAPLACATVDHELMSCLRKFLQLLTNRYRDMTQALHAVTRDLGHSGRITYEELAQWCGENRIPSQAADQLFMYSGGSSSRKASLRKFSNLLGDYINAYVNPLESQTVGKQPFQESTKLVSDGPGRSSRSVPPALARDRRDSDDRSSAQRTPRERRYDEGSRRGDGGGRDSLSSLGLGSEFRLESDPGALQTSQKRRHGRTPPPASRRDAIDCGLSKNSQSRRQSDSLADVNSVSESSRLSLDLAFQPPSRGAASGRQRDETPPRVRARTPPRY
eukprot:TRINITY_DN46126_c0_g1_i1.p1 TRINITY_DN46126_c0_g1~~TRINITY_DN46126_c0_g1_i1.p1  ORF type:complete len:787 (-),score=89.25 TRINITY_DN46126_c0_g1_i1:53-2089(-)